MAEELLRKKNYNIKNINLVKLKFKIMKSNLKLFVSLFVAAIVAFSCGSEQKVDMKDSKSREEITLPLSGSQYQSDKETFRTKSNGTSIDMATAKKIAMLNAKGELASLINTKIKAVTDQYVNQRQVGENSEFEQKFEDMTRSVVNQQLNDIRIIGEKTYRVDGNKVEYWVAIEMKKDAVMNAINDQISKKKKLQLDFDKHKYEEVFNKEMAKFEQEN
jgi:hypothetical protein